MLGDLRRAAAAVVLTTVVLGLAYPLALTGAAQVLFPAKADGDRSLIAAAPTGDPADFQPRPSATGYDPAATFFSNRGPNQRSLAQAVRGRLRTYLARERPFSPGLRARDVPTSAVTTSASGVDPHIQPADAAIQARRVAAVRGLPLERVRELVDAHTDGLLGGLLGDEGVNVRELNLALDREMR